MVDELHKDSKDAYVDSGIWGETYGSQESEDGKDDSSSATTDAADEAAHFPILDPIHHTKMSVNEIAVYAHFIKIGDIDTKNQRFSAYVEIIARWIPEKTKLFNSFFQVCKENPFSDVSPLLEI